jgi:succinyl-diaminopimelate desuccinylase
VAYPHRADNPVHRAAPALAELVAAQWDAGSEHFPPTSFQISNIHGGTGADNVIPGELTVDFNFRYSTAVDAPTLQQRVREVLERHDVPHRLDWRLSGEPFLTAEGRLVEAVRAAVRRSVGREAGLSTAGGTSDGRFIAPTGAEVVELGPVNASIHKVDEHVALADLEALSRTYEALLDELLG